MDKPDVAYRVPFRLQRPTARAHHRLVNLSTECVYGVSLVLHGPGLLNATPPIQLAPNESMDFSVSGQDLARATILVVRWFRSDGTEYLWRISF